MTAPVEGDIPAPAGFTRLPGLFRRAEVDPIATDPNFWVAEVGRDAVGVRYAVWTRTIDATEVDRSAAQDRSPSAPTGEPMSAGELKARRRDEHLCFRCLHYTVCRVASAADHKLFVTITRCLAYKSADGDRAPN